MLDKGLMEDGKKCITKREADKATVVPVEESKWDLSLNSPNTFPGHSNFHFGEHSHLSKFVVYNCVIPNTEFFPLHFRGEGFGGNVSPFRVRYLISIPRPLIRPNFHAKLHKGKK